MSLCWMNCIFNKNLCCDMICLILQNILPTTKHKRFCLVDLQNRSIGYSVNRYESKISIVCLFVLLLVFSIMSATSAWVAIVLKEDSVNFQEQEGKSRWKGQKRIRMLLGCTYLTFTSSYLYKYRKKSKSVPCRHSWSVIYH